MVLLALLAGCMPGPNEETIIDDLRVVAAVVEPPEIAPDEAATVDLHIADPLGLNPDVLVWTCTRTGPGCAERDQPLDGRSWAAPVTDGIATVDLPTTVGQAAAASDTVLAVELWTLACEPGACDIFERWRNAVPGTGLSHDVAIELEDPGSLISDVEFEKAALAVKRVFVSSRPAEERARNPVLDALGSEPGDEEGSLTMSFSIQGDADVELWAYATSGGFASTRVPVDGGVAELDFFPGETRDGEVFVVAVQDDGGAAVWRGAAPVRE